MKTIANTKAAVATTLNFLLKMLLFIVIVGGALFIFNNVALGEIKSQNAVRNLGTGIDVLALSTREIQINASCPSGVEFSIDKDAITATTQSSFGAGSATYYYLHEKNAALPSDKSIVCTGDKIIEVSKTYDKATLEPIISVKEAVLKQD